MMSPFSSFSGLWPSWEFFDSPPKQGLAGCDMAEGGVILTQEYNSKISDTFCLDAKRAFPLLWLAFLSWGIIILLRRRKKKDKTSYRFLVREKRAIIFVHFIGLASIAILLVSVAVILVLLFCLQELITLFL